MLNEDKDEEMQKLNTKTFRTTEAFPNSPVKTRKRLLFCIFAVLFLIGVIMLLSAYGAMINNKFVSYYSIVSESDQWRTYTNCVSNEACDICSQKKITFVQPPNVSIALLSIRGTGGTYLRQLHEATTRINTGTDECQVAYRTRGGMYGECSSPIFFTHVSSVRLTHPNRLSEFPLYNPGALIFMNRNPFAASVSAFHFYETCSSSNFFMSIFCAGGQVSEMEFVGPNSTFPIFARNYALEWMAAYQAFDAFSGPKVMIDFDDLKDDKIDTLSNTLEFTYRQMGSAHVVSPVRALKCLDVNMGEYAKRASMVTIKQVFSADLIRSMCAIVGTKMNAQKWGLWCADE